MRNLIVDLFSTHSLELDKDLEDEKQRLNFRVNEVAAEEGCRWKYHYRKSFGAGFARRGAGSWLFRWCSIALILFVDRAGDRLIVNIILSPSSD